MNYELAQVAAKLVITLLVLVPVLWGLAKLWQKELDLGSLLSPRKIVERTAEKHVSWVPEREQDAIYQGGKIVARVSGVSQDESHRLIEFQESPTPPWHLAERDRGDGLAAGWLRADRRGCYGTLDFPSNKE